MIRSVLRKAMLALFMLLTGTAIVMGTIGNSGHRSYCVALILAGVLVFLEHRLQRNDGCIQRRVEQADALRLCAALSLLFLLVHASWVLLVRLEPENDYLTFWRTAVDLAGGNDLRLKNYVALYPHILGYSFVLSGFLRLFGESVTTAVWLNVLFSLLTGILIYVILFLKGNRTAAAAAFLLWTIIPSKMMYNTMVLSEPYYTFLLVSFFYLIVLMDEKEWKTRVPAVLIGAAAGISLFLVNTARPIGVIPIIAFIIWILFLRRKDQFREKARDWLLFFGMLILCYGILGNVWHDYARLQLGQEPASIPGYNIYVGFNLDSMGAYSEEDNMLLGATYDRLNNADEAQRQMFAFAKERIRENKAEIPRLMLRKLALFMGNDEGGVYYSRSGLSGMAYSVLCVISNTVYYYLCIRAIMGCVFLWKKDNTSPLLLLPLYGIGLILAQMLVEVSGRYHYSLIPVFAVLASLSAETYDACRHDGGKE